MLEDIKAFYDNNTTMVLLALVALVAIIGFVLFRNMNNGSGQSPVPTPSHDLDGMESMNSVCDMTSGMCQPPEHMAQMSQEQEQQMMMQQQIMMQQMQQQQMQNSQEEANSEQSQ
jgi:hypothetical protein